MKKICFIPHSSPDYLGGLSLFHRNLIDYIKKNKINLDITWVYFGDKNRTYIKENIRYIEVKHIKASFLTPFLEKFKFLEILKRDNFDIVSCASGIWSYFYKKPKNQQLIHTYHGSIYYFNKNHLKRFNKFLRFIFSPILLLKYISEIPSKKADKLICVSEKVKRDIINLYGKKENIFVVRTGVNLEQFKPRNKNTSKSKLGLERKKIYGLYVGRGSYWTKGLDRAIKLSEEIYNREKNYRLLVIGPEKEKVKNLINKKFVKFLENIPREKMPLYYNSSDIFFCLSRFEGGAPTLVVSESMASGCMLVCSKDSEQEIIKDKNNGLIISKFDSFDAIKILKFINNKEIIKNSLKTIKKLSLESWAKKYLSLILSQNEHKI